MLNPLSKRTFIFHSKDRERGGQDGIVFSIGLIKESRSDCCIEDRSLHKNWAAFL